MSKNIRLLQVVPSLNSGGVERGTLDIAESLSKLGHFSSVASNGGRLMGLLKKTGSKHFDISVNSKNPFIIYKNISNLKKILLRENINIIHTRSRAPAWTSYYASKNIVKSVSTYHNVYNYKNNLKRIYNSGLAKMDAIIAISNFVKNKIIDLYKIPEDKITVIYRGIDQKIYNLEKINELMITNFINKNNIVTDKKIILFPGRLTGWKGQIEFLRVVKILNRNDIHFYFVGDDKNVSYSKKFLKEIINLNLGNNCKILGHIDEMKCMYKLSHLIINASQKPEGFGRVIAEAMAMGKPVIAYDHGGASEQLAIYDKKFRIPLNNYQEMAQSINDILEMSQDSINLIGQKSSNFVKKNFIKENMISQTINLYQNLLN